MKRGTKLLYKKIFAGLLGGGMLFMPNWSYALPSGGQVVTNNGTITAGSNVMDITGSGNVVIDWNSFNIAANEAVNFKNMQAVLNYVSGGSKSEIFGKLNGAGVNVFLVNPNGILFGKTAQVNVGQLTASTRSLEKADLNSFNGSLSPLDIGGAANVKADIINLGKLKAGKLVLEGNNLSIIDAESLEVTDKSKITLRAGENINIGYEVTDKTTINVGDGKGNTHQVSDYGKGGGDKASDVLSAVLVTDLKGSTKSINDAMLVHDVYELQAIDRNTGTINGSSYVVGNYMLAGDIDAGDTKNWNSGRGFEPIGRLDRTGAGVTGSFSGVFDGMGYGIQNLYIKRTENYDDGYIGLFEGIGKGGSVGNVNIVGGHIEGISNFGSIAGLNWGTIYNIVNSATIESKGSGGGIVGTNGGIIRDTINKGTLNINGSSGGIAGANGDTVWGNAGTIINVRNSGNVTSSSTSDSGAYGDIGGIVGRNNSNGIIIGAENTGKIEIEKSGSSGAGGIAGNNYGNIENVKNSGRIIGYIYTTNIMGVSEVGGIVGANAEGGSIKNAENTGTISGDNTIGGIAGSNRGAIDAAMNTAGSVTSRGMSTGGVTGYNEGSIKDSFNNASIICGTIYAGGVAGSNENGGSIKGSYNTGAVTGKNHLGGIAGGNNTNASIANSYNTGQVNGTEADSSGFSQVGGISGYNKGDIKGESYNSGDITASGYGVGGITGYNYDTGVVGYVHNEGNVTGGTFYVGGIAGYTKGALTSVYNTGNISGASGAKYVGGITGYALQNISNAYNTGDINGSQHIGGIAGYAKDGTIESTWNAGTIKGVHYLAGIVGNNASGISNSYNEGAIVGSGSSQYIAGIAGYSKDGKITNVYTVGTVSGYSKNYGEISGAGNSTITNAYYKTDTGYKKSDDNAEYSSVKDFNQAFLDGMQEGDKALWLSYGDKTTPLLRGLLQSLNIDIGDIEVEYSGSAYTGLAQAIADKLAEQGIIIDVTKLLAEGKTEIGEYDLKDLLFSTQDGYALNVTGKLVIKEKSTEPEFPADNYVPSSDSKYTGTLTNIKAEKMQQEEYRNLDKRRRNTIEQASVSVEGDGIKLE